MEKLALFGIVSIVMGFVIYSEKNYYNTKYPYYNCVEVSTKRDLPPISTYSYQKLNETLKTKFHEKYICKEEMYTRHEVILIRKNLP